MDIYFNPTNESFNKDINLLINDIYRKTNIPFVIIIDEWDCVIRNSNDEELNFSRNQL